MLDSDTAGRFARLTLSHIGQQWPYKMDHVLTDPDDARPPIAFHPIFHGSFDWHSCVHGWWQMLRLARRFPKLDETAEIRARADTMLVADKVEGELAYLSRPFSGPFERPYGWGWLLALHDEAMRHDAPWGRALDPLARAFAARFHDFLPKLTYPIRTGTHFNTAFALILARRWAVGRDAALIALIDDRARHWFGDDRDCQAWEPGGDDFLSGTLIEAMLMREVLGAQEFADWFGAFLPRLAHGKPATLFAPAHVSDRSDGKIAHLDGLNLSRAWCWRALGRPDLADAHLAASLPHLDDDYMGGHWLATFALLALDDRT
ncbi:DUF2891 domain-containing protein [Sphingomonas sp.]|uniref:DUF2891 domain-containing protein n=1 Tax=Sphingomonas sp. TaxID=28214 RepID=UPI002DD650B8|nr:DUF2891 domain-containing protein [Sphingomonas sp.]